MPTIDDLYKLTKVLHFLTGCGDSHLFALLSYRGFTNAIRREGWALLSQAGNRQVDMQMPAVVIRPTPDDPVRRLFQLENEWWEAIEAPLARKLPAMRDALFDNLRRAGQDASVLNMRVLLDRVDELAQQRGAGKEDVDLLESRGFTPAVRATGRELLRQITGGEVPGLPTPDAAAEAERVRALDDMWHWYQDWSRTARTIIRRKDLRIRLGIAARARPAPALVEGALPVANASGRVLGTGAR